MSQKQRAADAEVMAKLAEKLQAGGAERPNQQILNQQTPNQPRPKQQRPSYKTWARRGKRYGEAVSVADLLGPTMKKHRLGFGVARSQALLMWPKAVGTEVARMTKARSFQRGTLYVEARDSAAAHHLSMQRVHFMHRLNELLLASMPSNLPKAEQPELVHDIRFGTGYTRPQHEHATPKRRTQLPPLPPLRQEAAKAQAEAVPEGDLRRAVQQAAEAVARAQLWREQQGLPPCPVCGQPSRDKPCRACQLTLREPAVRRLADLMTFRPELVLTLEEKLGYSGAQAARFLALEGLEGRLLLLALECLQAGGAKQYHAFLRQQCHYLLAIRGNKPLAEVTAADYVYLPEQVRQVLLAGRGP